MLESTDMAQDQEHHNLQKQMGCMAGFLHILSPKKLHTKRLTSPASESPKLETPSVVPEINSQPPQHRSPVFDLKEETKTSWKFKETHRLSLDSRAAYDAKGSLHRKDIGDSDTQKPRSSTSVIAKLMGFEPIQQSEKRPHLRRSASESRASRDLFQNRVIQHSTPSHFISVPQSPSVSAFKVADPVGRTSNRIVKPESKGSNKSTSSSSSWRLAQHRKSFFEAAEIFPEASSGYGEKEKRLGKRCIDEASNDLETLKNILEAWQLKGLLHSNKQQFSHRNIVYESRIPSRNVNTSGERPSSVSPRRERNVKSPTRTRGSISPTRSEGNVRRSNNIVTSQRVKESTGQRRGVSPPRRSGSDSTGPNRNSKKPTAEIRKKEKMSTIVIEEDTCCSISESTVSTSSERSKMEEKKEGKSLLERCGKLLDSIAEMNGKDEQTSPVSVLDSSFYESASPSPINKRIIDAQDVSHELVDEDTWNQLTLSSLSKFEDNAGSELYCDDLVYISDILRSSHYLPRDSDIFLLLEKQQCFRGKDTSQVSRLHRKLIFDITNEILERNRRLPAFSSRKDRIGQRASSIQQIWSEFANICEYECSGDDLVDIICGVLRKDLNTSRDAMNGWGEYEVEFSEVVLDIERMIFRDLVGENIRDLATLASQSTDLVASRRKLVF